MRLFFRLFSLRCGDGEVEGGGEGLVIKTLSIKDRMALPSELCCRT